MIKNFKLTIFALLASGLLSACVNHGTSEMSFDRYSLVEDLKASSFTADYKVNLDLTKALDEGGVVVKTSDVTLRSANNHRWSSNLKDQLTAIVCEKLNDYQVRKDLDIKIFVSKFYGTTDGNVTIEMNVGTTLKGKPYFDKIHSFNEVQAEDGYASLVETLKKGFFNLSANLAQDLSLKD